MALIPPRFINCVVAIGTKQNDKIKWIATGFLVGRHYEADQYHYFIVTNKHVLESKKDTIRENIIVRFNSKSESEPAKDYFIPLDASEGTKWAVHPTADVGVIFINANVLVSDGRVFDAFSNKKDLLSTKEMESEGVSVGDFIYILGYPLSVDPELNYVIVRSGSIARIGNLFKGESDHFIGDAFIFPGNSGGPVVLKPEIVGLKNTKAIQTAYLIGIVKGHKPYSDIAISAQTGKKRVIFEENSGLCAIIPTDFITETIEICVKNCGVK